LALLLSQILLQISKNRWSGCILIGAMGIMMAMPGPIVNLLVLQFLDRSEPKWFAFLADRTLLGPILALQSRCLPVVFGMSWIARERFANLNRESLQLDRGLSFRKKLWIEMRGLLKPITTAFLVSVFVAFGDQASYLLVQPPGVTSVAMRMFDLLHYGIKNREAGLALAIVIGTTLPATFLLRRILE